MVLREDFSFEDDDPMQTYGVRIYKNGIYHVSKQAPEWYALLACLHEKECTGGNHPEEHGCEDVEKWVLSMIDKIDWRRTGVRMKDEEIKKAYVEARIKMFKRCISMYNDPEKPIVIKMQHTLGYLKTLSP